MQRAMVDPRPPLPHPPQTTPAEERKVAIEILCALQVAEARTPGRGVLANDAVVRRGLQTAIDTLRGQ